MCMCAEADCSVCPIPASAEDGCPGALLRASRHRVIVVTASSTAASSSASEAQTLSWLASCADTHRGQGPGRAAPDSGQAPGRLPAPPPHGRRHLRGLGAPVRPAGAPRRGRAAEAALLAHGAPARLHTEFALSCSSHAVAVQPERIRFSVIAVCCMGLFPVGGSTGNHPCG